MKVVTLLFVSILLIACSSAPMGSISVRSVDLQGQLTSPLESSKSLVADHNTIFKTQADGTTDGNDVYAIYLTDAYLKYLADWWGVNEVIFVVEFTEAVTGDAKTDTTTKILGPYNGLSDGIKAPLLNKALYGPKKMESDLLSMNIKIYEYDLDESSESSAMLEFISSAAESFSLSNPITLGEIKLAKEIANTLLLANENDLVMEMDMDFVAGSTQYVSSNYSNVLPLKDGQVVIVKQEGCSAMTCYWYFSRDLSKPEGILPDVLLSPFTFLKRAFTDTPENSTLTNFKDGDIGVGNQGLYHLSDNKLYQDKTWIRLNIVKGGDSSQWAFRKKLYPTAEKIDKLLRNPYAITGENIEIIVKDINEAQKTLTESKRNILIKMTSEISQNNIHFIESGESASTLCIYHPEDVKVINMASILYDSDESYSLEKLSSSKQGRCYNISPPNKFAKGTGDFIVNYEVDGVVKAQKLPFIVRERLSQDDATYFSPQCSPNEKSDSYKVELVVSDNGKDKISQIQKIGLSEANQNVPFTVIDSTIKLDNIFDQKEGVNISIKDIFGGLIKTSISSEVIKGCLLEDQATLSK